MSSLLTNYRKEKGNTRYKCKQRNIYIAEQLYLFYSIANMGNGQINALSMFETNNVVKPLL